MKYLDEVKCLMAEILQIPATELAPDADMTDVDSWDSMRNIMILQTLEDHFDVMFPEDDVFDLTSVNALAEEIEKLKG